MDDSVCSSSLVEVSDLIFLGVGSSGGTPKLTCLTAPDSNCNTCKNAVKPGNPNRRRNTSAIVRTCWYNVENPNVVVKDRFILIDCGKSFNESALDHFPVHKIPRIDTLLLTHGHADACLGLDDLRPLTAKLPHGQSLPIYLRQEDFPVLEGAYGYLMPSANHNRFVASLQFNIFNPEKPLNLLGLEFLPLPVEHGPNYTSLGYAFGDVVYISDINRMYDSTHDLLQQRYKFGSPLPGSTPEEIEAWQRDPRIPLGVFVLDALFPEEPYNSHYSMEQALQDFLKYRPKRGLTVGMSHQLEYEAENQKLKSYMESHGLDIQLAYDGMKVSIQL